MEAAPSSEIAVTTDKNTRCHNQEDSNRKIAIFGKDK